MNIITNSNEWYMTYEYYIKQPMQLVELNLNMIIAKNPHLINSLYWSIDHPPNRKNSNLPFNIQGMHLLNISDEYIDFINCTNNKNENIVYV